MAATIPKELLAITNFLISSKSELKSREGILDGKRVVFFKGTHIINALLRQSYKNSKLTEIGGTEDAIEYLQKMLDLNIIIKVIKESGSKTLAIAQSSAGSNPTVFAQQEYYCWLYEGSKLKGVLMGVGVLLVILVGVMFPLWPPFMRQGSYYLSQVMIGMLALLMGLGVVRAIIWTILIITLGRGGWLFPNLFADVGVIESFQPLWKWDKAKKMIRNKD